MVAVNAIACVALLAAAVASDNAPCPVEDPGFETLSLPNAQRRNIRWKSNVPFDAIVHWIDFDGKEQPAILLPAGMTETGGTFSGHAFRVRSYTDDLLMEYRVEEGEGNLRVEVNACGDLDTREEQLWPAGREAEYESLVHDQDAPCVGPSREWSCVRRLSYEEWQARGTEGYGFLPNETTPDRVGLQTDQHYVRQIPMVPKVGSRGNGYLKMSMPKAIRDVLLPWFHDNKHLAETHEPIPGGYTNVDKVPMAKLNLDHHANMRMHIVKEMQHVLQWWTKMRLRHTSTYGIRIYKRGSMLINHVDRMDTHLASAVMQVDQEVDEDGGWPLEVLLGNRTVGEVYLKPGEMVLYEGAWLRHGRPMRFKGDSFANIFTHFSPFEWKGPGSNNADTTKPLPHMFHGYSPGRCDTIADIPGQPGGCVVTEIMDSVTKVEMAKAAASAHDEL